LIDGNIFSRLSLKIIEAAGKLSKGEGGCEKRKKKGLKDEQKKLKMRKRE
jgi:hypothetical protein